MSQEELIPLIYKKEDVAFTILYDRYAKTVFGLLFNLLQNEKETEEVLQDVFVKIWQNIETYDETKGRFYTWIICIARNAALDRLQTNGLKPNRNENFVQQLTHHPNTAPTTATLGTQEFVKKLKPKGIKIIDLLFYKGCSEEETAMQLEIPLTSLKVENRIAISDLRNLVLVS